MKTIFTYNLEKDAENFLKSLNSQNNKKRTKFQEEYIAVCSEDFDEQKVREFIQRYLKENTIDTAEKLREIENNWKLIEDEFIKRCEKIFSFTCPDLITVYLTTNNRCTYNIPENYFFVYLNSKSTNAILMHELFHFYTWHAIGKQLVDNGLSKENYNDIKESLTELLNIEFADLMDGIVDEGYPQHQELRARIRESWNEYRDLQKVITHIKLL